MIRTSEIVVFPALLLLFFLGGCAPQAGVIERGSAGASKQSQPLEKLQLAATADLQRAERYLADNDYPRAKASYEKIFSSGAHIPVEAYYRYGYVLNRTGDFATAIEQFASYTQKVNSGQGFYTEAMQEWSFALIEQGKLAEQASRAAEEQSRQQTIDAALSAAPAIPAEQAQALQAARQQLAARIVEPLTGMELLLVKGGCYQMGDHFGDADEREMIHEVCVDDFYLGKYEVTQGQWQQLMGYNPALLQGENYPLETVSWLEAQAFLQLLNSAGENFRLPTEAEWEYAARSGGQLERFSGGSDVAAVAWYTDNSAGTSQPVGQKQANGLGLYDMSGNVAEWVQDYFSSGYYKISPRDNPAGAENPSKPGYRMVRGGGFGSDLLGVRSSERKRRHEDTERDRELGFRVALPVAQVQDAPQ